jgi:hypothetical protein
MVLLVGGPPARTEALSARAALLALILAVDLAWSFSYTLWPRKAKTW